MYVALDDAVTTLLNLNFRLRSSSNLGSPESQSRIFLFTNGSRTYRNRSCTKWAISEAQSGPFPKHKVGHFRSTKWTRWLVFIT